MTTSRLLALAALPPLTALGAAFTFPQNPAAVDATGRPLYVDDATLIHSIPALNGAGKRLRTCLTSMTLPQSGYIEFMPTVTGAHSASSNRLQCEAESAESITCTEPDDADRAVVFDADPSEYFRLGPNTDLDEALEIARAFRNESVDYGAGEKRFFATLPLREIAKKGTAFSVHFSDCGCHETIRVERQLVHGRWGVYAIGQPDGMCV